MTARLPRDLHEWVRQQAFDRRISMNDVLVAAVEAARDQQAKTP